MLVGYIRRQVELDGARDVKGFQFTLTRATGYDTSTEPEIIFVSPYTPLRPTLEKTA